MRAIAFVALIAGVGYLGYLTGTSTLPAQDSDVTVCQEALKLSGEVIGESSKLTGLFAESMGIAATSVEAAFYRDIAVMDSSSADLVQVAEEVHQINDTITVITPDLINLVEECGAAK